MGFKFSGFFAQGNAAILDAALQIWPGCRGRLITEPFHGFGIAVPEHALTYGDLDEEQEQSQELAYALEDDLVGWSQQYPETVFVFLNADCFGGTCLYAGYVCQNGRVLERVQDRERGGIALPRLVHALGVELDDSYHFTPLARGYFDRSR
jgi:hypothetical protein